MFLTSINYPLAELYPIGWTPIGGPIYPVGNFYERDAPLSPFTVIQPSRILVENRTNNMLGEAGQFWESDLQDVNYPFAELYGIGWTPIGAPIYPLGNSYNRDFAAPIRVPSNWSSNSDIVGNWKTANQNQNNDMVSLSSQTGFFDDPLNLSVDKFFGGIYPIGLTPIGADVSRRSMLGIILYG